MWLKRFFFEALDMFLFDVVFCWSLLVWAIDLEWFRLSSIMEKLKYHEMIERACEANEPQFISRSQIKKYLEDNFGVKVDPKSKHCTTAMHPHHWATTQYYFWKECVRNFYKAQKILRIFEQKFSEHQNSAIEMFRRRENAFGSHLCIFIFMHIM